MTDKRNNIVSQPWRDGKNGQLKGTIKELSKFDNK